MKKGLIGGAEGAHAKTSLSVISYNDILPAPHHRMCYAQGAEFFIVWAEILLAFYGHDSAHDENNSSPIKIGSASDEKNPGHASAEVLFGSSGNQDKKVKLLYYTNRYFIMECRKNSIIKTGLPLFSLLFIIWQKHIIKK